MSVSPPSCQNVSSSQTLLVRRFDVHKGIFGGPFLDQLGMLSQQVLAEESTNDCACRINERLPIPRELEGLDHRHICEAHVDRAAQCHLDAWLRPLQI